MSYKGKNFLITTLLLFLSEPRHAFGYTPVRRQQAILNGTSGNNIVGGELATNVYPYFGQWEVGCAASLIHDDIMVTAAHCGINSDWRPGRRINMGSLVRSAQEGISRNVIKHIKHPLYDASSSEYDFMLIKLNASALLEPTLYPSPRLIRTELSPIPLNRNRENPRPGEPLKIMGFGKTSSNSAGLEYELREATVFAESDTACVAKYSDSAVKPAIMFCAADPIEGRDSCQGDSGAPIVDGSGVQVGLVSWGRGCGIPEYPGVYARISAVADWLDDEICQNSCFPPSTCHPDKLHPCATTRRNFWGLPIGPISLTLMVQADAYPHDTAIALDHLDTESEIFFHDVGDPLLSSNNSLLVQSFDNIPAGVYHVTLFDQGYDGFCCPFQANDPESGVVTERRGYAKLINKRTGEVLWSVNEDYGGRLDVYINVDEHGDAIWVADNPDGTNNWPNPETDDPNWPGEFTTSELPAITFNIKYDDYPQETTWAIARQVKDLYGSGGTAWETTSGKVGDATLSGVLFSYEQLVDPGLYRLQVTDSQKDGICCFFGAGWLTVTNNKKVLWKVAGDKFKKKIEVYFWVDSWGEVQVIDDQKREVHGLDYVDGLGYVLVAERTRRSNGASATVDIILTESELQYQ